MQGKNELMRCRKI